MSRWRASIAVAVLLTTVQAVADPMGAAFTHQGPPTEDVSFPSGAKRPMPEDCNYDGMNRCQEVGAPPCASDEDCLNESRCVPPPGGQPGDAVCYAPKNRYLSIAANRQEVLVTARRLQCADSGQMLGWLGDLGTHQGLDLAHVIDQPEYHDAPGGADPWPDVVHVIGWEIAPNEAYLVQAIQLGDDIGDEGNYSEALQLPTVTVWGDIVGGSSPSEDCTPADGILHPDADSAALLNNLCPVSWRDLDPEYPDQIIGLGDILAQAHALQGLPYPWGDPCPEVPVPTVSEWGVTIMTLFVLAAGTIAFRK